MKKEKRKAQGINSVLISIINQQENGEWRREAARKCKARRNGKKYASFRPVSASRGICINVLIRLWVCDKHQHPNLLLTTSPQAVLAPLSFINFVHRLVTILLLTKVGIATSWLLHGRIKEYVLIDDWCVGRAVLIDYGNHESDEFWPEVQVLYWRTLLLTGNVLFPALQERNLWQ